MRKPLYANKQHQIILNNYYRNRFLNSEKNESALSLCSSYFEKTVENPLTTASYILLFFPFLDTDKYRFVTVIINNGQCDRIKMLPFGNIQPNPEDIT